MTQQSRKLTAETLEEALALTLNLESGLKGGRNLADNLQVELAVMKLSP